jgi:hypothetical protein
MAAGGCLPSGLRCDEVKNPNGRIAPQVLQLIATSLNHRCNVSDGYRFESLAVAMRPLQHK